MAKSKAALEAEIRELKRENADLQDQLDAVADIVGAGDEDDEDDEDED